MPRCMLHTIYITYIYIYRVSSLLLPCDLNREGRKCQEIVLLCYRSHRIWRIPVMIGSYRHANINMLCTIHITYIHIHIAYGMARSVRCVTPLLYAATRCITLQHAATHCNTLQPRTCVLSCKCMCTPQATSSTASIRSNICIYYTIHLYIFYIHVCTRTFTILSTCAHLRQGVAPPQ